MQLGSFEREPAAVRHLVTHCGCVVKNERTNADGTLSFEVDCPTVDDKLALLLALGAYDGAWFPDVARLARAIASGKPTRRDIARAVQIFVQDTVSHTLEGGEVFPSTPQIVSDGVADCDDHAIVVLALLTALGFDVAPLALYEGDAATHVCVVVNTAEPGEPDVLEWCETTLRAELGEEPRSAATRLQRKSW